MTTTDRMLTNSVAIIGAGLCGLTAARQLAQQGVVVQVLEKEPHVGGRIATLSTDAGPPFDHGAQYGTAKTPAFRQQTEAWIAAGIVAEWNARIVAIDGKDKKESDELRRYVGVPGMNALPEQLAEEATNAGAQITTGVRVASLKRTGSHWRLTSDAGESLGDFARVLITTPAPQAAELLTASPALANAAKSVRFASCWAAVVAFDERVGVDFDAAFVNDTLVNGPQRTPLSWIAHNNSKPGRTAGNDWVLHGSHAWSAAHADLEPSEALEQLLEAFWQVTGASPIKPSFSSAHRWRYALPETPLADMVLIDHERGLYAGGDWCGAPCVEGAYLSGLAAAKALL